MSMKAFNMVRQLSAALIVISGTLNAAWNPQCLSVPRDEAVEVLKKADLQELEQQVFEYLKGSWCSQDKAQLILELTVLTRPKVAVEIGSFTGSCTLPMLAGLQYLGEGQGYAIDAWNSAESIRGLPKEDVNTQWWAGLDMQAVKNHFVHTVNYWSLQRFCQTLHMPSRDAVSQVPAIDFLHLDGNFSEEGARHDAELYITKVRKGGHVLLSNALMMVGGKASKTKALWIIFNQCELIEEIDNGNTLLFRKN